MLTPQDGIILQENIVAVIHFDVAVSGKLKKYILNIALWRDHISVVFMKIDDILSKMHLVKSFLSLDIVEADVPTFWLFPLPLLYRLIFYSCQT